MLKNDQSVEIATTEDPINQIERFADRICDQLFINDTYYGNLLITLTEMMNLISSAYQTDSVKVFYNTDYQKLKLKFQPIEPELVKLFNREIGLENIIDNEANRSIFLINKLSDGIEASEADEITIVFDISALHKEIYDDRSNKLLAYLSAYKKHKVKSNNDHLQ